MAKKQERTDLALARAIITQVVRTSGALAREEPPHRRTAVLAEFGPALDELIELAEDMALAAQSNRPVPDDLQGRLEATFAQLQKSWARFY